MQFFILFFTFIFLHGNPLEIKTSKSTQLPSFINVVFIIHFLHHHDFTLLGELCPGKLREQITLFFILGTT